MKLKEYLEKTNTSKNALAKKAGVAPSTIYKFVDGTQNSIKPEIARAISEATDGQVGIFDLLFPDEDIEVKVEVVKK